MWYAGLEDKTRQGWEVSQTYFWILAFPLTRLEKSVYLSVIENFQLWNGGHGVSKGFNCEMVTALSWLFNFP